jgi:(2R)-ethylmalonyl-CoA mutase
LPRPWDQQWSLRLQQIGALETDMLEYGDIFDGSHVIEEKTEALVAQIRAEIARVEEMGGAASQSALEYMKERLVRSNAARVEAIETGEEVRVGVNAYPETEPSPLTAGNGNFVVVDASAEREQIERLTAWRHARRQEGCRNTCRPRTRRQGGRQHRSAVDRLRQGRCDDRRVVGCATSRLW